MPHHASEWRKALEVWPSSLGVSSPVYVYMRMVWDLSCHFWERVQHLRVIYHREPDIVTLKEMIGDQLRKEVMVEIRFS